jgi:hypothetical protein
MSELPEGLAFSRGDDESRRRVVAQSTGIEGMLAELRYRARPVALPGPIPLEALQWRLADNHSRRWWPQGVSVGQHGGIPIALVSWFAQPNRGHGFGSRISVVALRSDAYPEYDHVALVTPRLTTDKLILDPVRVHAGGIACVGDRLFVAATFGGIREFRLSDITRAPGARGHRWVLPELGVHRQNARELRYSFLSAVETPSAQPQLVAGEYRNDREGRLATLTVSDNGVAIDEVAVPGIPRMQGATRHDDLWVVSASNGDRRRGDLWMGPTPSELERLDGALPPGPEDLAIDPDGRRLWSLSEYPGRRWLFTARLEDLTAMRRRS